MDRLADANALVIRQQRELMEAFTGLETRNRYVVEDDKGNTLYQAAEEKGSVLIRFFLKASRPFSLLIKDSDGNDIMKVQRPYRFFMPECTIYDKNNVEIGRVKWNFSLLRKKYTLFDKNGMEVFRLFGPALKPWTFEIRKDGTKVGVITKKWSGFLKEAFTDTDNFGVIFDAPLTKDNKALLLGAVFLIDFVHFENKS